MESQTDSHSAQVSFAGTRRFYLIVLSIALSTYDLISLNIARSTMSSAPEAILNNGAISLLPISTTKSVKNQGEANSKHSAIATPCGLF